MLGVESTTIIESVDYDPFEDCLVATVRPSKKLKPRCGICQHPSPRYDQGEGTRRWRALDLSTAMTYLEALSPRVNCPVHGVTVAWLPWARHQAGHTRYLDEQAAWLATITSKSAVTELLRIAWRTVGSIVHRVWEETSSKLDLLDGLKRIGIDEISHKKGRKYLTVVVCHDTGRLVWASTGRTKDTLRRFFDPLEASGEGRCARIAHVSVDGADWIGDVVAEKCINAIRCADPFHRAQWAMEAMDEVRKETWNKARKETRKEPKRGRGRPAKDAVGTPAADKAKGLKGTRYALWKNPQNLNEHQQAKLAWVQKADSRLYRACLLKERLRLVFQMSLADAAEALEQWVAWARRCRIPAFVKLQRRIVKHRARILASIEHGLSNGRIESMNTKIRLITRMAFGFRDPQALISMAMLSLGGYRPVLSGRD